MRKIKTLLAATIMMIMLVCLSACDGKQPNVQQKLENTDKITGDSIRIVTTVFPEYDWVREILGANTDHAEITLLIDNGVDPHSYQPTTEDILKISTCDLFLYVGGESDAWVNDILAQAANQEMVTVNLLDVLGDRVKEEELTEGMEAEENAEEEPESDEHVWLSLRNATLFVEHIADVLADMDAANAQSYKNNADIYCDKLEVLDKEYKATVDAAPMGTLLFGDRFPFRYMVDDYGLEYYAAFPGCSAETEASFETVIFLANKLDELSLHTILTIEGSDGRIAETIKGNTISKDQQILVLNSLQSVSLRDAAEGVTYLTVMTDNLNILKEALK